MNSLWSQVPLSELVTRERRPVEIDPKAEYAEIGIYSFGRGIFHKSPRTGFEVGNKKLFLIKEGDFIFQITFAWEGAVGLASAAEDGMYGSVRFPTFRVDESKCYPPFLLNYFRTGPGREQLVRICPGSAGRNRVLSIKRFPEVVIPLPPLEEQRRIVARIEELAAKVEAARALRQQAAEDAKALQRSMLQDTFDEWLEPPDSWPVLASVIERIENGWSPSCLPYPADEGEWGVLKVGAVSTGQFVPGENKTLPAYLEPRPELEIRPGDFLFGRANTRELVGACTVVQNPPRQLMLCDKIFRFVFKPNAQVDKLYLDFALKSPPLREQIEAGASGTSSSMKNISKTKVMQLRLPLPPLDQQHRIVAYLDALQAKVEAVKQHQATTATALDALLPSILDRAFQGEL